MLFLVWSLIDFMILCRGGEHEEFIVLEYFVLMSLSAYSGVDRDRAGAYAYFWMIPVKELTKLIYSKSIQTHTPSAGLWSQFPTRLYRRACNGSPAFPSYLLICMRVKIKLDPIMTSIAIPQTSHLIIMRDYVIFRIC